MTSFIRPSMATLVAVSLFTAGASLAEEYRPEDGDEVVVYTNTFRADSFDTAKRIMVEEYGEAMAMSKQARHTYWIANPETHQIVGISFFDKGHPVDTWHDHDARQAVLEKLEPLRGAPLVQQRYVVIGKHNTGG